MIDYQTRLCGDSKLAINLGKADSNSTGEISGYASVWDVPDLDGDVVRKGAFGRSINNQIAAGKVMLMARHFRDGGDAMEVVGKIIEAREDNVGFWIRAKLSSSSVAQKLRDDILLAPEAYGMSVGWRNVAGGYQPLASGTGQEYTEMNLKEVTITLRPANEDTIGTVKAKTVEAIEERLDRLEGMIEKLSTPVEPVTTTAESTVEEKTDAVDSGEVAAEDTDSDDVQYMETLLSLVRKRRNLR